MLYRPWPSDRPLYDMSACINWWNKSVSNLSALYKYNCRVFFFKFIFWCIFESDTLHGSTYIDINLFTRDDEDGWWWWWWWWDNKYPSFFRLTYASIIDWNQIKNCSSNKKKDICIKTSPKIPWHLQGHFAASQV